MNNLIIKENFNWKKYINRYKDLKNINNIDNAWVHWCEEGKKQGRKFYTLEPYKNNKYYIITKEYIKHKKNNLKNNTPIVMVSSLDDDIVIRDFVSNIKKKIKKNNCLTINENIVVDIPITKEKEEIKNKEIKNKEVKNKEVKNKEVKNKEIKNKEIKNKEVKNKEIKNKKVKKEEWTERTENSEIFFIDFEKINKKDCTKNSNTTDNSEKYFNKKNSINIFSKSTE